jgi:hypothetical protein
MDMVALGKFKELSQDGSRADFAKNFCAYSFQKELSNETTGSLIHLESSAKSKCTAKGGSKTVQ